MTVYQYNVASITNFGVRMYESRPELDTLVGMSLASSRLMFQVYELAVQQQEEVQAAIPTWFDDWSAYVDRSLDVAMLLKHASEVWAASQPVQDAMAELLVDWVVGPLVYGRRAPQWSQRQADLFAAVGLGGFERDPAWDKVGPMADFALPFSMANRLALLDVTQPDWLEVLGSFLSDVGREIAPAVGPVVAYWEDVGTELVADARQFIEEVAPKIPVLPILLGGAALVVTAVVLSRA